MVDVGDKNMSHREAHARSTVRLPAEIIKTLESTKDSEREVLSRKGPVFQTAILAGIMATRKTSELIPLCHNIPLENSEIQIRREGDCVHIDCTVRAHHKTGVEMEALTGASIAALTIYDMLKALSHDITIETTRLISKSGGRRDFARNET